MNYYELLGIPQTASVVEVRRAFRLLVQRVHPDHNKDPQATEQFITAYKAYQTLIDPRQREYYDSLIAAPIKASSKTSQQEYQEYAQRQQEYVRRARELLRKYLGEEVEVAPERSSVLLGLLIVGLLVVGFVALAVMC